HYRVPERGAEKFGVPVNPQIKLWAEAIHIHAGDTHHQNPNRIREKDAITRKRLSFEEQKNQEESEELFSPPQPIRSHSSQILAKREKIAMIFPLQPEAWIEPVAPDTRPLARPGKYHTVHSPAAADRRQR